MQGAGKRVRSSGLLVAVAFAVYVAVLPGAASGGAVPKAGSNPYVALGDSYTVGWEANGTPTKGFVGRLFPDYSRKLGAGQILNTGVPGESSSTLRNNGQLTTALAAINAPSDTRVVTLEIGGADGVFGSCAGHWDDPGTCPFRANFSYILRQIRAALAKDPGSETLLTTTYPNPSAGTGTATERSRDTMLLGDNLKVGCSDSGAAAGLNDAIYQEAGALGVPVADPYPAFEQHGQDYMSTDDPMHLHPNDAGYAAIAAAFRQPSTRCGATPDLNPPDTTIKSGPARTHDPTPTFTFKSSESHSKFKCALDSASFRACSATYTTPTLALGRHTLDVEAKDRAGNVDPAPAAASFKVVK
jgi:lysophospholipase L1-like esterase